MPKNEEKPRWNVERRLEFIEFRLYWDGRVNRSDLVDFFGISIPQASADLNHYQEVSKGNLDYDKSAKCYVAGRRFKPVFLDPSADVYLVQLRQLAAGLLTREESWVGEPPPFSVVPLLRRRLDSEMLRLILSAIRTRTVLEVNYQSFSTPSPKKRRLAPHAFGFDGYRWHIRAWCYSRSQFCDFVVARILDASPVGASEISPADDAGWSREVTLRLAPHPDMEPGPRRAIELDFGMENGVVEIATKACLAYYMIRQMGLDQEASVVSPKRQQLVLLNRKEVESAAEEARGRAEKDSE